MDQFAKDVYTHLADIVADVDKVKKAFADANDDWDRKCQLSADEIESALCDISNKLDDLYNGLRGLN